MTRVFHAPTRVDAWHAATEHLLANGEELNLVLDIAAPAKEGERGRRAIRALDELYGAQGQPAVHSVAETIFPGWEYKHRGLEGMSEAYLKEFEILRRSRKMRWGTYAHRLLSRPTDDGSTTNPLATMIDKMRQIHGGPREYKACYELGFCEAEAELPLYRAADDENRWYGGPCLSHLSFKLVNGTVHLTALYRSHDYRFKVPGNLLGLARLQACVAREVGADLGTLVVHSTLAGLGNKPGIPRFRDVVKGI